VVLDSQILAVIKNRLARQRLPWLHDSALSVTKGGDPGRLPGRSLNTRASWTTVPVRAAVAAGDAGSRP
jgi:hypothetical protein